MPWSDRNLIMISDRIYEPLLTAAPQIYITTIRMLDQIERDHISANLIARLGFQPGIYDEVTHQSIPRGKDHLQHSA